MKNKVLKTLVLFLFAVLGIFSMQKVEAEVIYEGYKISKQDITGASVPFIYVKSSDGEVENVYCFNLRLTYPPTQWEGTNYPKYKKEEANSNQMDRLASNKRLSGDELRDAILKVIYYGDSENGNRELQKKYRLSDVQFHDITQKAIWYFTDMADASNNLQHDALKAYRELIDIKSKTLPENIKLNIYTTTEQDKDYKPYQNLLSAKILNSNNTIHTPQRRISIKVNKEWKGIEIKDLPEITIYLVKNGKRTSKFVKLNSRNNWQEEFRNLTITDSINKNKENVYEIVEDGEIGGEITLNNKRFAVSYKSSNNHFTVTNSLIESDFIFGRNNFTLAFGESSITGQSGSKVISEDTLTSFKGRKFWKNDAATDRPEAIQVQLYADGVAVEGQTKYVSGSGDEWSFEFKNLKKHGESGKEIVYSVKEVTVPAGYDVTYSGNDIINTKREVIIQQGPILGLEETLPTEEHQSGDTTTIEDTRPIDTMSGLSGETGQSGNTTIEEDSTTHVKFSKRDINGKELAGAMIELRNLSGQTIQSWVSDGTVKDFYLMPGTYQFVETAAPEGYELAAPITFTIDEKGQIWVDSTLIVGDDPIVMIDNDKSITEAGQSIDFEETLPTEQGQSGSTTEVEDTKGPDVMIGGQGEVVDIEESLPTEQGQSGSTTEVEDTKGPDVMIGGQGEIVEFEKTLPNEHGQSGSTTEVEDSKPKISIHFDNEWPKEEKTQLPAVEKPKAKVSLPATGEAEHVLSTIVGAMILFLVSLWGLLKRKASKA
ncbi:cell surface fibronectin binding protein (B) FbpB [Streptococcus dysgalactiae subsp. equisimilis]|uniref:Cna B-type domain-containing protein n=1 Tax=Streptococcus dysgalactiae TaxID=1334 RepID=UPI0023DE0824|nr:Cna B-type domain-containing protein [Streptococcus dysgalactiae]WEQ76775.1 cell surface fibronectin binding protein (B) FbpB [Streptococcus dysgalactiae subsp. equisimilis]